MNEMIFATLLVIDDKLRKYYSIEGLGNRGLGLGIRD